MQAAYNKAQFEEICFAGGFGDTNDPQLGLFVKLFSLLHIKSGGSALDSWAILKVMVMLDHGIPITDNLLSRIGAGSNSVRLLFDYLEVSDKS